MKYPIELKYRFELLIPLSDNQGRPFPWVNIERVGIELLNRFEGCRSQPIAPHLGFWKHRGIVYRERLLMFTSEGDRSDESLSWILKFKEGLKGQFNQIEIYLAVTEIWWL